MRQRPSFFSPAVKVVLMCSCFFLTISCAHQAPVKIALISDQRNYGPDDPIAVQIRVINTKVNWLQQKRPLVTSRGFFSRDYHLLLTILDPEGIPVPKKHVYMTNEPQPPYRAGGLSLAPVEIIAPGHESVYLIEDVRDYYDLRDKYGWHTAYLRTSLRTFCWYKSLPTGELAANLKAWNGRVYSPVTSNRIRFEIKP